MTREEFLEEVLGGARKRMTATDFARSVEFLDFLCDSHEDSDTTVIIGCSTSRSSLIFALNEELTVSPNARDHLKQYRSEELFSVLSTAAEDYAQKGERSVSSVVGIEAEVDEDLAIIIDLFAELYIRDKGGYTPRPGSILRIANLRFTDVHSDPTGLFIAFWAKRRLA